MAAGWAISGAMAGISRSVIKVHNEQVLPCSGVRARQARRDGEDKNHKQGSWDGSEELYHRLYCCPCGLD